MLIVLSPAKKLNWDIAVPAAVCAPVTTPVYQAGACALAARARAMGVGGLQQAMQLSNALADLTYQRFVAFQETPVPEQTRAAMFAFAGDTYQGLSAKTLSTLALERAGARLRIISGLYGLLRPLDAIQPYRLEMGSRFSMQTGADLNKRGLYAYWGDRLAHNLNVLAAQTKTDSVLSCASHEYLKAVHTPALQVRVVTARFLEREKSSGRKQSIGFYAKRGRGALARFVLENDITEPRALVEFADLGYCFAAEYSSDSVYAFVRDKP